MKYAILITIVMVFCFTIVSTISCKNSKTADSVKIADSANRSSKFTDDDIAAADFLVKIADARMMGKKEGTLAVKKGTTPEIINYGKLMIKDQDLLLGEIKKLASARNITLPPEISNDKKDGFKDLNEKTGKDFDNKFIKMMRIDHERDIKDFKKALDLKDKPVMDFAAKYLPLIQSHLDKLNEIKD